MLKGKEVRKEKGNKQRKTIMVVHLDLYQVYGCVRSWWPHKPCSQCRLRRLTLPTRPVPNTPLTRISTGNALFATRCSVTFMVPAPVRWDRLETKPPLWIHNSGEKRYYWKILFSLSTKRESNCPTVLICIALKNSALYCICVDFSTLDGAVPV